MAKMTTEQYNSYMADLKSGKLSERDLTDEEREALYEYEASSYGMPSKSDQEEAAELLNSYAKDPTFHGGFNEEDKKWAEGIINQANVARDLMISDGKDVYVRKVKEVPDDVIDGYGFKFNWKGAYENETGEKLRPTEADADKLKRYIQGKFDEYEDPKNNLKNIAYKMHMIGNADEDDGHKNMWSNFIASDRFPEFQKYIEDVRKYQTDREIDRIFDEDSNFAADWVFPVSKEYARNKIKRGEKTSMVGPIAFDLATQAFMFGPGKSAIKNPLLSTIYGTVTAPAIMEAGNVMFNDKPMSHAAVGAIEGAMINAAPQGLGKLQNIGAGVVSRNGVAGLTNKQIIQNQINKAADAADAVKMMKQKGYVWSNGKDNFILKKGKVEKISSEEALKHPMITDNDQKMAQYGEGRIKKIFGKASKMAERSERADAGLLEGVEKMNELDAKQKIINKLKQGHSPTSQELYSAGIRGKESLANFVSRNLGKAEHISRYGQNMLGRPEFGREAGASVLNTLFPEIGLFEKKDDLEKGTDRWYRYYGLK